MKKIILNENSYKMLFNEIHLNGYDWETLAEIIKKGYLIHGTTEDFDKFDPSKIKGGNRAEFGYGMYFTDAPYKALEYGQEIYITKENIYNFLDLDKKVNMSIFQNFQDGFVEIAKAKNALDNARNNREYDYYNNLISELEDKYYLSTLEELVFDKFIRFIEENPNEYMEHAFKYVRCNLPGYCEEYISNIFLKLGYDGVKCGNQFVIFNYEKLNNNLFKEVLD